MSEKVKEKPKEKEAPKKDFLMEMSEQTQTKVKQFSKT